MAGSSTVASYASLGVAGNRWESVAVQEVDADYVVDPRFAGPQFVTINENPEWDDDEDG